MASPTLTCFDDQDEFLRRVGFESNFKRDVLRWKAFKEQDPRMSWTFRNNVLFDDKELDAYHGYFSERFGQPLAAVLRFTFFGLTRVIDPPLEPRADHDPTDAVYGHLHCSTDQPRDQAHMERLAKLVMDGVYAGIAKRYPKPKA